MPYYVIKKLNLEINDSLIDCESYFINPKAIDSSEEYYMVADVFKDQKKAVSELLCRIASAIYKNKKEAKKLFIAYNKIKESEILMQSDASRV